MKIYEGKLVAQGMRVGIVASRFNEFIVSKLLSGCEDALLRHGVLGDAISVAWVPGAFEIPVVARPNGKERAVRCGNCAGRCDPGRHQPLRLCL